MNEETTVTVVAEPEPITIDVTGIENCINSYHEDFVSFYSEYQEEREIASSERELFSSELEAISSEREQRASERAENLDIVYSGITSFSLSIALFLGIITGVLLIRYMWVS